MTGENELPQFIPGTWPGCPPPDTRPIGVRLAEIMTPQDYAEILDEMGVDEEWLLKALGRF